MSIVLAAREAVLSFSTGVAASAASTFVLVRLIYQRAEAQCEAADARIVELRRLQGGHDETPRRQPMAVPSLLDIRLRRDLSCVWNEGVLALHDTAGRWL